MSKKKKKQERCLHSHTILTFVTIFTVIFRNDIIIFFFLFIKDLRSLAFAIRSRNFLDLLDFLCSRSRRCFIFFLYLFFCRDFCVYVDFCFRHVNEIKSLIVIKSMIVFIFFIYFVNETRSITLCSLTKSKRRCLEKSIQRQKTSRIFSTIYNFCCAKRATRILL